MTLQPGTTTTPSLSGILSLSSTTIAPSSSETSWVWGNFNHNGSANSHHRKHSTSTASRFASEPLVPILVALGIFCAVAAAISVIAWRRVSAARRGRFGRRRGHWDSHGRDDGGQLGRPDVAVKSVPKLWDLWTMLNPNPIAGKEMGIANINTAAKLALVDHMYNGQGKDSEAGWKSIMPISVSRENAVQGFPEKIMHHNPPPSCQYSHLDVLLERLTHRTYRSQPRTCRHTRDREYECQPEIIDDTEEMMKGTSYDGLSKKHKTFQVMVAVAMPSAKKGTKLDDYSIGIARVDCNGEKIAYPVQ